MSKGYHQIATCSEDKTFKIWELDYNFNVLDSQEIVKESPVWKVSWNFMGNLLAVSFANEHKQERVEVYYQNNEGVWVSDSTK
jgi:WD40 repeat protein